ncbi:MAG: hypothetical protein L6R42_001488 [Xanthoria sp. 1 TBL-2021]|nr:MAG: hypothetical protein L6R42_001488 [Xanthoria sp. 1 TBL-2021]
MVASVSAATAAASFDAGANTNMAVYWGQGPNQQRLAHFCADSSIDIIPIAFLNVFPDQVNGGYPGTNFGNQCGPETFKNKDGSDSPLLSNCPLIGPDIKTCQAMGKKLLLSLGGAIPTNQSINNDESAVAFAHFLWNAFGPEDATYHGPRPFGDAVIDGFDFDIESAITGNDPTSQYRGYGTMIDTLRILFAADIKKDYYISGSPQCVIPDAHLAEPIETSWFDFLFIQFYNTPQCSARAYFDDSYGRVGDKPSSISFDAWVGFVRTSAMNKDVKLYIGLPAAPLPALAYDTYMYIAPDDVNSLIDVFQCRYPKEFGGIMVFEATYSEQNLIDNKPFVDVLKNQLTDNKCAKPATSTSSTMSSTATPLSSLSSISSTVRWPNCPYWYRLFVNPIIQQHWCLEWYLKFYCNHWDWVILESCVSYTHWYLERYFEFYLDYRDWVILDSCVSFKHGYLERYFEFYVHYWYWVFLDSPVPYKYWYLERYLEFYIKCWYWVFVDSPVPYKYWYLERDDVSGP